MKLVKDLMNVPKALPFETKQALYGISILLTFVVVGRFGVVV